MERSVNPAKTIVSDTLTNSSGNSACLFFFPPPSSSVPDHLHHPLPLNSRSQILIPDPRNQNIILNPHAPDFPVPVQDFLVDEGAVKGRGEEVSREQEAVEVDAGFDCYDHAWGEEGGVL